MTADTREIQPRLTVGQANLIGLALDYLYDSRATTPERRDDIRAAAAVLADAAAAAKNEDAALFEYTVVDEAERTQILAGDMNDIDGIRMDLLGEDSDAVFALTTDWAAVAERLPKLLAEYDADSKRFDIAEDSVRWAQIRRRPHVDPMLDDPGWTLLLNVMDNGRPRPFASYDEGAFQCVYVEEEWTP